MYKSRKQEILETLKVGDEIIIGEHNSGHYPRPSAFATVTKVTKTQITVTGGNRYLISDGEELGTKETRYGNYIAFENAWNDKPLSLTTRAQAEKRNAEILAERELRSRRAKLDNAFSSLTLTAEQVEAIAKIAGFEIN